MTITEQKLFETYCEAALKEAGDGFGEEELAQWLEKLSIGETARFHVVDGLFEYYYRWASESFGIGLRLGLSLLDHDVRRLGPEKV